MRTLLVTLAVLAAAAACQRGSNSVPEKYRADIENICDAEARSGALAPEQDPNRRAIVVATWLPGHIQTDQGRQFLGSLQKLNGAGKGDALRGEAARVGLSGCPLADTWK